MEGHLDRTCEAWANKSAGRQSSSWLPCLQYLSMFPPVFLPKHGPSPPWWNSQQRTLHVEPNSSGSTNISTVQSYHLKTSNSSKSTKDKGRNWLHLLFRICVAIGIMGHPAWQFQTHWSSSAYQCGHWVNVSVQYLPDLVASKIYIHAGGDKQISCLEGLAINFLMFPSFLGPDHCQQQPGYCIGLAKGILSSIIRIPRSKNLSWVWKTSASGCQHTSTRHTLALSPNARRQGEAGPVTVPASTQTIVTCQV